MLRRLDKRPEYQLNQSWTVTVLAIALLLVIGLALLPQQASAGANAYVTAELTWSNESRIEDLTALPAARFPLFLRVHGAQRVRQIATNLEWYPMQTEGGCYQLLSATTTDSCGAVIDLRPGGGFGDDDSWTWTSDLPGHVAGDLCLRYEFTSDSCGSILPGRFLVTRLAIVDSTGAIDEIVVDAPATILGGAGVPDRLVVQRAGIATLYPGATQGFRVVGWGFDSTAVARIELDSGRSLQASSLTCESATSAFATFTFPDDFEGWGRLVVANLGGPTDTLPTRVLVSDTTAATGSGVNGNEWPLTLGGSGGAWTKAPGESVWVFEPAIPDSVLNQLVNAVAKGSPGALAKRILEFQRTQASRPAARTPPREGRKSGVGKTTAQTTFTYADTLLFAEDFEGGQAALASSGWLLEGAVGGTDPTPWGVVDSTCGRTRNGRSLHCATVGSGNCNTYLINQGAQITSRQILVEPTRTERLLVDCATWVDTDSIVDANGNYSDRMFACYSEDDGFHWQFIKPGYGYFGRERAWLTRRLLDRSTSPGEAMQMKLRVKFLFASSDWHMWDREGAYVDDIVVRAFPHPNLTFQGRSPAIVISPNLGERYSSSVAPGRTNYLSVWTQNNSSTGIPAGANFATSVDDGTHTLTYLWSGSAAPNQASGSYVWLDQPVSIPQMCGAWYDVTARLDGFDRVREMNESVDDNTYRVRVPVVPAGIADLVADGAPWSGSFGTAMPCVGEPTPIQVVFRNAGSTPSASCEVGLYEGLDRSPTTTDTPQQTTTLRALAAGARDTVTFWTTSPTALSKQFYFLVDRANVVDEACFEGNNAAGPLLVTWQPLGADLAATSLDVGFPVTALGAQPATTSSQVAGATGRIGTSVPVSIRVSNFGQAATPKTWTVSWFRDLDRRPTVSDVPTRTFTIKGALAPDADTTISFSVTSTSTGTWRMRAYVNWPGTVAECGRTSNNAIGPSTLTWISDSLVVRGVFTYRDTGYVRTGTHVALGAVHPVRGARVEVWDRSEQNRLLGTTCTDESGVFAIALGSRWDPEWSVDELEHLVDVYARVVLSADTVCAGIPAVTVCARNADTTWAFTSPVHWDVRDSVLDLGEISPPLGPAGYGHRSAMHIYDAILRGAQKIKEFGFQPLHYAPGSDRVYVKWGEGGLGLDSRAASIYRADTIWVVGSRDPRSALAPDEWDDAVLLHEYGHHLARRGLFADFATNSADCKAHDWAAESQCPPGTPSVRYAWEEGWSDFIAARLGRSGPDSTIADRGYGSNDSLHVLTMNLESGVVRFSFADAQTSEDLDHVGSSGPSYEAANAAALWDWVDTEDDDAGPGGCSDHFSADISEVLDVMLSYPDRYPAIRLDSLANLYDAYRQVMLASDPVAARVLYEMLCDHGWWGPDSLPVTDAGPISHVQPVFVHSPSPASGPVRFAIKTGPGSSAPVVEVFDVAGRTLWREAAVDAGGGHWRATWSASARAGVYFARCRAQGMDLRRTIVLRR